MGSSRRLASLIGIAAAAGIALAGCAMLEPAPPGMINGVIYEVDESHNPKPGVPVGARRISLFDSETGDIVSATTSGADGRFSLSVPPGKYSLWGGEKGEYVRVDSGKAVDVKLAVPSEQP